MNNIEVSEILKATNGELILGNPESRIAGISTDSRGIELENIVRQIDSCFSRKKENNSALLSLV